MVMIDAGFEAILGTVLILGDGFGHIDRRDFPGPGNDLVLALLGLAFVLLGMGLASLTSRDLLSDPVLSAVAASNAGFALLIVAWILVSDGFSAAGQAVVWITAAVLLLLATEQARLVRAGEP